jgi:hypothetical protein
MSFLSNLLSGGKEAKKKSQLAEANAFTERLKADKAFSTTSTHLMLQAGEHAFLQEDVVLSETRAVRKSVGGFGGFRIAKGVIIGGYRGTSESHQEWRSIDRGQLVLTDKRLVFDGNKENRAISLDKIISFNIYLNSISVSVEGKSKDVNFEVKNPYIWACSIQLLKTVENPLDLKNTSLNLSFE